MPANAEYRSNHVFGPHVSPRQEPEDFCRCRRKRDHEPCQPAPRIRFCVNEKKRRRSQRHDAPVSQGGFSKWKTEISVSWPQHLTVDALSSLKKESVADARARMCDVLRDLGVFNIAGSAQQPQKRPGVVAPDIKGSTQQLKQNQERRDAGDFTQQLMSDQAIDMMARASEMELQKSPAEASKAAGTMVKSGAVVPSPVLHQIPDTNGKPLSARAK
ncbi:hypothetical protein V5799_001111 [Amblyomma americanum]|uniref:Uncharacterized protein n=1 Tax=Amblyomma americanum TaxID=6943 RepID=A0AAQ4D143_AMBAM